MPRPVDAGSMQGLAVQTSVSNRGNCTQCLSEVVQIKQWHKVVLRVLDLGLLQRKLERELYLEAAKNVQKRQHVFAKNEWLWK